MFTKKLIIPSLSEKLKRSFNTMKGNTVRKALILCFSYEFKSTSLSLTNFSLIWHKSFECEFPYFESLLSSKDDTLAQGANNEIAKIH